MNVGEKVVPDMGEVENKFLFSLCIVLIYSYLRSRYNQQNQRALIDTLSDCKTKINRDGHGY